MLLTCSVIVTFNLFSECANLQCFRSRHSRQGFPLLPLSGFHSSSFRSCRQAAASRKPPLFFLPAGFCFRGILLPCRLLRGQVGAIGFYTTGVPGENASGLFARSHRRMIPDPDFDTNNAAKSPRVGVLCLFNFIGCCRVVFVPHTGDFILTCLPLLPSRCFVSSQFLLQAKP